LFEIPPMAKEPKYTIHDVFHCTSIILSAGLAIALWFSESTILAGIATLIAILFFVTIRRLHGEIRKANEQKRHLDQQLIQSQKLAAIGELSSGIAHEINNPLAIIGQETEWIKHVLKDDNLQAPGAEDELRDSLQEIVRQVDRCREITHKLLDFARKKEPLIQSADVNRLIEDMARLIEKEAANKNIKIIRNYLKDLPRVKTDPPLLRQVVLNLLNNAAYAIGKDGEIVIRTELSANNSIALVFSDTGCGIPKEQLDKVFDPFFTTKPPGKGTGLGLSISHSIIAKLGGRITVASEPGKGATFTIHLPLTHAEGEQ
jgi:two-component system, NtrC family, sensor kinase